MKALGTALRSASRSRLAGHAVGLACYEALALVGAAGDLAWLVGIQAAPALLLLDWVWGSLDGSRRLLRHSAGEQVVDEGFKEGQLQGLRVLLRGLTPRAALRCLAVWLATGLVLKVFCGLTWPGLLLVSAFGAIPASLSSAGFSLGCAGVALAELGGDVWPQHTDPQRKAPSLGPAFFWLALAPPVIMLAPLAALIALGLPLSAPILSCIAVMGLSAALVFGMNLRRRIDPALRGLGGGLRAMAAGDFSVRPAPTGEEALDEALAQLGTTAAGLQARELALKAFGPDMDPALGVRLVGSLNVPPERHRVAVLCVEWLDADAALCALEFGARLGALSRFYQTVQEAAQKRGGFLLEVGGGRVLAAWGAPFPMPENDVVPALKAAWSLRSVLAVLASQHALRQGVPLQWGLGLAVGDAIGGAWGPQARRRWTLSGFPLASARRLALRAGGPWLDEAGAGLVRVPFAASASGGAFELTAGIE